MSLDADMVGTFVAGVLTLLVFSYLWGENPLFRVVEHVFIGVSAGYAVVVAVDRVLVPLAFAPAVAAVLVGPVASVPIGLSGLIPVGLTAFLVARRWPGVGWLAFLPLGVVLGVGLGLGLTGAIAGTLIPQIMGTGGSSGLTVGSIVSAILVIAGLSAFHYTGRWLEADPTVLDRVPRAFSRFGRLIVMFALGAAFADLTTSRLTLLAGRLYFLIRDWPGVFHFVPFG